MATQGAPPSRPLLARFATQVEKSRDAPHADGWGLVLHDGTSPRYLGREAQSALAPGSGWEEAAQAATQATAPATVLAHLRKSSQGAKTMENAHPFLRDDWAFCHNGTIYDDFVTGEGSDSARFFEEIVQRIDEGEAPEAAIRDVVRTIRERHRYSSLTFLLTNGEALYAYREWGTETPKPDWEPKSGYYTLFHANDGKRLILCQEPVADLDWTEIPQRHLLVAKRDDVRVAPLP